MGAAVLVLAWVVGHTLTDRYVVTQYLWWVPTVVVLVLAWPMVFVAWSLEKVASRLAGFQLRPLVTAALFVITVVACFRSWHVHRYLMPAGSGDLRVVYWNLAVDPGAEHAAAAVLAEEPDLAVVANPRWGGQRNELLESLASLGPIDADPAAVHVLFRDEIAIATRGRLTRFGQVSFEMGSSEPEDRGVVVFVEVTGLAGEPTTVWVVDLPSRVSLHRAAVTARAREAIEGWTGPEFVADDLGRWEATDPSGPFPPADLIVGDFNTPRGSGSLSALTGGLVESHAAAGRGLGDTWPREFAILPIDLLFADAGYRIRRHRVPDPGSGRHRMLVVELSAP